MSKLSKSLLFDTLVEIYNIKYPQHISKTLNLLYTKFNNLAEDICVFDRRQFMPAVDSSVLIFYENDSIFSRTKNRSPTGYQFFLGLYYY